MAALARLSGGAVLLGASAIARRRTNQKTETFLRCLENATRHFGGVPVTTTPDNLKAAVLHPDWYDPELNPKLASFAMHYIGGPADQTEKRQAAQGPGRAGNHLRAGKCA